MSNLLERMKAYSRALRHHGDERTMQAALVEEAADRIRELEEQLDNCQAARDFMREREHIRILQLEAQLAQEKKYDIEKQRDIWAEYCKEAWTARDIAWEQIKELEAKLDAVKKVADDRTILDAYEAAYIYEAIGEQSDG